jgi:DHA3 family macrolide efflux protein-like MFS transporter
MRRKTMMLFKTRWRENTALFLVGQALTLFGTMLVQYAILWHVTLRSQSGTMMMLFTIIGFLPMFFISPFAGVWADRFNKKYIINISDGTIAVFSLLVAVLLILGIDAYGILLACAFVRSIGQGIQSPAVGAFIPEIVPEEHLIKVNGFQSSIQSVVTLTSPMLSGALMTFAPLEILFFIDVITAAIGIIILFFFVKVPQKEKAETEVLSQEGKAYFHDLKEGLKYIRKNAFIFRLIIITAIFLFVATPVIFLTPLQVTRNFGADVWRLSAIEITFSIGMMLGGVLIGVWGGFKNRIHTMAFACVLWGLLTCALGFVPFFIPYLIIMALLGIIMPIYDAPERVLIQTNVDPAFMGRVISILTMVSSITMPVGMLVFGPLADIVSIDILLISTGLPSMLLSLPLVMSKTLRKAGMSE